MENILSPDKSFRHVPMPESPKTRNFGKTLRQKVQQKEKKETKKGDKEDKEDKEEEQEEEQENLD